MRWSHLVRPGGHVLDVACGSGRHMRWFAQLGCAVTGVDQSAQALATAANFGDTLQADLELAPWPLGGQRFDGVVVTNYLWRPLFASLLVSLAPGGVLLYETFAQGHELWGRPTRAEFLLAPGELLQACAGLHIVAYEEGFEQNPTRKIQRIAAINEVADQRAPYPALGPAVNSHHRLA